MGIKNTDNQYGSVSRALHWTTAILVIGLLSFGFFMGDMPKAYKPTIYMLHKSTGILVLVLTVIRLIWLIVNVAPKAPSSFSKLQGLLAKIGHLFLYAFLIAMPISGLVMSIAANRIPTFYNLFPVNLPFIPQSKELAGLANTLHELFAFVMIALVLLHILAAFHHRAVLKDGVFERMACRGGDDSKEV